MCWWPSMLSSRSTGPIAERTTRPIGGDEHDVVAGDELRSEQPQQRLAERQQHDGRGQRRPERPFDRMRDIGRQPRLVADRVIFGKAVRRRRRHRVVNEGHQRQRLDHGEIDADLFARSGIAAAPARRCRTTADRSSRPAGSAARSRASRGNHRPSGRARYGRRAGGSARSSARSWRSTPRRRWRASPASRRDGSRARRRRR